MLDVNHTIRCTMLATWVAALGAPTTDAQEPATTAWPEALAPEALRAPLHRSPSAAPEDASLWAAMDRYKARFEDGFELFPALGAEAPAHLPLRWTTERVQVGEALLELTPGALPEAIAPWSLQYRHPAWSERYDVLVEGVEQSFVFDAPFDAAGDLVIRGRIATPLRAAETEFASRAIDFKGETGRVVLRYGEGTVIDSLGRTAPVESRCTGEHLELRVRAEWLAQAAFPIIVDPLTSPIDIGSSGGIGGNLSSVDLCHHDRSFQDDVLVAVTRAWTASDHDVFALKCPAVLTPATLVYSDVSSAYSDTQVSTGFVAGGLRWIVATQRDASAPGGLSRIRLYVHAFDSGVTNSGAALETAVPASESHSAPQLGSTNWDQAGSEALLVYQSDAAPAGSASSYSEVRYAILDPVALALHDRGPCSATPAGARYDRERPSVNGERRGNVDGWVVVWSELDRQTAGDDWDLRGMRTDVAGQRAAEAELVDAGGAVDASFPRVAGLNGDYLLGYGRSTALGQAAASLHARCFEWPLQQAAPTLHVERSVGPAGSLLAAPRCARIAFDRGTRSHWVLATTRRVPQAGFLWRTVAELHRVGGSAATVETQSLFDVSTASSVAPAVCFDLSTGNFVAIAGPANGGGVARGARLTRPSEAVVYSHGTSCGLAWTTQDGIPLAGNRNFGIYLLNAGASSPAFLLLSAGPSSLSLDGLGLTNCVLRVDLGPLFLASLGFVTDSGGDVSFPMQLPDAPAFFGDVYLQWVTPQAGANPAGYVLTRGLQVKVR